MQTTRWATALCALIILSAVGPVARAQQAASDGKAGKPGADAGWSTVLTPGPQEAGPPPATWSKEDIEEGRARCAALLKDLDLVAVPADPIREGEACGTPAPMKLVSIGSNPPIAFSPPPELTCDMIAALHKWLEGDVQALARKHLGAPIVGVKVMSSYSCRTAYSRAKTRLSEHGRVNALDLAELLTAQGETTQVLADWGPTAREVAEKGIGSQQADAIKRQAEAAAAARKGKVSTGETKVAAPSTPSAPKVVQGSTFQIGIPGLTRSPDIDTSFGLAPPSRLGGPKEAPAPAPAADQHSKTAFLHAIHDAACRTFATVLGPDANRWHRNHFHLDMAVRASVSICE